MWRGWVIWDLVPLLKCSLNLRVKLPVSIFRKIQELIPTRIKERENVAPHQNLFQDKDERKLIHMQHGAASFEEFGQWSDQ